MKVIERGALALCAALAACGSRPARFSAEAPRWNADDERPVAMPAPIAPNSELYHVEAYSERAVVSSLEVSRPPLGVDVNRYDEVVESSWYRRPRSRPLGDYRRDGPPQPPFAPAQAAAALPRARVVDDARGLRYELLGDLPGQPEARTAGVAIASRLLHAVGYRTPEAYVTEHEGERVVAVRWPAGVDLGPTPMLWTRLDDPNDVLPHVHRRTLRASLVFALWLGIDDIGEHAFRDAYVGRTPQGFVRHYFVGLEEALGSGDLAAKKRRDPRADGNSATLLLLSFGLAPKGEPPSAAAPYRGVGRFFAEVELDDEVFQPPFAPHQRIRHDDAYWAAKEMARVRRDTLAAAVAAAKLSDRRAAAFLRRALERRRAALAGPIFAAVTPCEPTRVEDLDDGVWLSLVDVAVRAGAVKAPRRYRVELLDEGGGRLSGPSTWVFDAARHRARLPRAARARDYVIVRLTAPAGNDGDDPRSMDLHLGRVAGKLRLLGVEH